MQLVPSRLISTFGTELKVAIVIIQNSKKKYFVHQRSKNKKQFPLLYGVGIGGKVEPEESFYEAASRELIEEIGNSNELLMLLKKENNLNYLFNFTYKSDDLNYESQIFHLTYNGPINPSTVEFEKWQWLNEKDILELGNKNKLCPDTKSFFKRFLGLMDSEL